MGESTKKLLGYLPQIYNKNSGVPGSIISIPGTGAPIQLRSGASNVYKLMDSLGFVFDNLFSDLEEAKQESYIGVPPVDINISYFPVQQAQMVDNLGNPMFDNSNNPIDSYILSIGPSSTTIDLGYYFSVVVNASNVILTLPSPTNVTESKYIILKNLGIVSFSIYGLDIPPGQTIILNWMPSVTIFNQVIDGYWTIGAHSYFKFNVSSVGEDLTLDNLPNTNNSDFLYNYALVKNTGSLTFTMYGASISSGKLAIFEWDGSEWKFTNTNYNTDLAPAGADSISGVSFMTGGNTWLDSVGLSYGTSRVYSENDIDYKQRTRQLILGNKISKPGISKSVAIVFNFFPDIFNWYASDYTELLGTLTSFTGYTYDSVNNTMLNYDITTEPNYPNYGIPYNFYVVVSAAIVSNLTFGVYANFSFFNWYDGLGSITTIPPYGGFFTPNPGEPSAFINTNILLRLGQFLHQVKLSGSNPIILVNQ